MCIRLGVLSLGLPISMVLVISLILCLALIIAIIGVMMPETVLPILTKLWEKQIFYWKQGD